MIMYIWRTQVKRADEKPNSKYGTCMNPDKRLVLVILVDGAFHNITPRQRIRALMQLASFMALDGVNISIHHNLLRYFYKSEL